MNPNAVSQSEAKQFAELLAHLMSCTASLPADGPASSKGIQETLKAAVGTFVLGGNLLSRLQAAQAASLNELAQRLEQIQVALNKLLEWAQQPPGQSGDDSADWWKQGSN
jgi:hypothetical protein